MKRDIKKLHRILTELCILCNKSKFIEGNFISSADTIDVTSLYDMYRQEVYHHTEYNIKIFADEAERKPVKKRKPKLTMEEILLKLKCDEITVEEAKLAINKLKE